MQQQQGLPPNLDQPADSWKFLLVAVDSPRQLFRPCTDPDPTTPGPCGESFPETVGDGFRAWIAAEYVIRKGTRVDVLGLVDAVALCTSAAAEAPAGG